MPTARLKLDASRLAAKGGSWFFADDLASRPAKDGLVRVRSDRGDDLGIGLFAAEARIQLRRCGSWPGEDVPDPDTFFSRRLAAALERRAHLVGPGCGVRLVHGEADQLSGLVVDRYDDCLVLQSTSRGIEANLSSIVPWLRDAVGARAVLARNDLPSRRFESLPQEIRWLDGKRTETVTIEEHGIRHEIRLLTGQKTGFFLDQRPARQLVQQRAAGRSVADLCSYQGGFSLAALAGGASSVVAVDAAAPALERASEGARANGFDCLQTECADVFDWLREARRQERRFDLIVLDPPAFAKSRKEVEGAIRGYRDLNRQALRLLAPGGLLLTCSCSHHMQLERFEATLRQAAAELPFPVWLRQRVAAGEDHPVALQIPESEYLKSILLERAP